MILQGLAALDDLIDVSVDLRVKCFSQSTGLDLKKNCSPAVHEVRYASQQGAKFALTLQLAS